MNEIDAFCILKSINDSNIYNIVNQITAVCFQEQDIYLGTKTGIIHKLEHQRLGDENILSFVTSLLVSLEVVKNSPIDQLEMSGILNLIIALSNESLIFINETPFNIQPMNFKLKGVTSLSVKEGITINDEFVTEMCIGLSSKKLQLYLIAADRVTLLKDINISTIPIALCLDHDIVCIASSTAYQLVNLSTELITDLFSFQSTKIKPKIAQLPNKAGLLLRGPDGLGIFADANGASQRPPIQWGSTIRDFFAVRAHIVAIDNEFITIHSLLNQQQIQTIHYPNNNAILTVSNTNLLIVSNQNMSQWNLVQLAPLSWSQMANQYISKGLIEKATSIVYKQLSKSNISSASKQTCSTILILSGFHKFKQAKFKDTKLLLEKGNVDLRELINCYPNMLPKSYKFDPKIATMESEFNLPAILLKAKDKSSTELDYKKFLMEFLIEHRDSSLARAFSQIVETALVKLYVELEPQKLFHNFTMMLTDVDYDDLVDYLTNSGHYHACAMVMQWYGQLDKAVHMWSRLIKNEISDPIFPGIEFLKEVLSNISDPNVIVKNIDWLLKLDPITTSDILRTFIDRFKNESDLISLLITDEVMKHIENYPDTLFEILYDLCQNGLLQNHSQHEHLAQIFMRKLSENQSDEKQFELIRLKFQQFLTISDNYTTQKLLNQVREFPISLLIEEAWILGQMSEHQVALEIIIHKLHDFKLAERYCVIFERKHPSNNSNVFLKLLSIYLSSKDPRYINKYKDAALNLLECQAHQFNMKEVLTLIPKDWPLNRLRQFLLNSSASRRQTCFTIKMKYGLEKVRSHEKVNEARGIIQNNKLVVSDWSQLLCSHCGNNIDNCSFIKTNSGAVLHKHCFNCA